MSRLLRRPSALQLLSQNAAATQTEQAALHAEVNAIKDALARSHTAYAMLRDDVERFKTVVRAQDVTLKEMREQVTRLNRELAALNRSCATGTRVGIVESTEERGAMEQMRRT